jgi:peptide deformylase
MLHSDYITHINNKEDVVYLRSELLPVNMRLFKTSPQYKALILQCCEYIKFLCLSKMDGYKKPHGMSGANAAIPFNIIGIVRHRGNEFEYAQIMINPKILKRSIKQVITQSNCGSLTLDEPMDVIRASSISVEWFDMEGNIHQDTFNRETGGFTIQHEVDHNRGVLIIDKILNR